MDRAVLVPSAILGLIFVTIYAARCYRNGNDFKYPVMINAVFQASGIVCGLFLVVGSLVPQVKEYLQGIDIYIFIAGLAVMAVSVQGAHKDIFGKSDGKALANGSKAMKKPRA